MALSRQLVVLLGLAFLGAQAVVAYDPTILKDYGIVNATSGQNFTDTSFEFSKLPFATLLSPIHLVPGYPGPNSGATGLGLASLFFVAQLGGEVPPHYHPRASEIFFVVSGLWTVGFINSTNHLFTADLGPGDQFIFPIGLIHYQVAKSSPATGYSAFNSESPSLVLVFTNLFSSTPTVPDPVLVTASKATTFCIDQIKEAKP